MNQKSVPFAPPPHPDIVIVPVVTVLLKYTYHPLPPFPQFPPATEAPHPVLDALPQFPPLPQATFIVPLLVNVHVHRIITHPHDHHHPHPPPAAVCAFAAVDTPLPQFPPLPAIAHMIPVAHMVIVVAATNIIAPEPPPHPPPHDCPEVLPKDQDAPPAHPLSELYFGNAVSQQFRNLSQRIGILLYNIPRTVPPQTPHTLLEVPNVSSLPPIPPFAPIVVLYDVVIADVHNQAFPCHNTHTHATPFDPACVAGKVHAENAAPHAPAVAPDADVPLFWFLISCPFIVSVPETYTLYPAGSK